MKHSVEKLLDDRNDSYERPETVTRDRIRVRLRLPGDRSRIPVKRLLAHVERRMVVSRPLTVRALRELGRAFELTD